MSLVKDRYQLGPEVPNSTISSSLLCDDRLTLAQRVDFGEMQMCSAKRDYQANSMVQIHFYCSHSVFTQLSAQPYNSCYSLLYDLYLATLSAKNALFHVLSYYMENKASGTRSSSTSHRKTWKNKLVSFTFTFLKNLKFQKNILFEFITSYLLLLETLAFTWEPFLTFLISFTSVLLVGPDSIKTIKNHDQKKYCHWRESLFLGIVGLQPNIQKSWYAL